MKVALLGPCGTYTHQAAERCFDEYDPVFCRTLHDVMEHDARKVIPFENSLGGGVGEAVDVLRAERPRVTGEQFLEIEHCLVAAEPLASIETVVSHPQALDQCRAFIREHGWDTVEAASTAAAAAGLEEGQAAIASRLAAEVNGLRVLEEGVQDRRSVTRFLVLGGEPEAAEKTSLILEPGEDAPGLLHDLLGCFADRGINLSYIQSRPTKAGLGEYFFYLEADAGSSDPRFEEARNCLEEKTDVTVLGSYAAGER
ncbi:MAG: prephenate dehydratase domain-containing protein [Candidatus Nanohaloarchaea archaeon]|nr:prephenate dehydratase domain-containing protein [Candidatus Nanohaloarchaea archaeon]